MSLHKILKIAVMLCIMLTCIGCGKSSNHHYNDEETITISAKPTIATLFYSDFINPIRTIVVRNTEAEGIVLDKKFEYGKNITKGQLLFIIFSQQLAKNFFDAVRQYVRSTETLANAQYDMEGEEYLKKLKIVSQQEYNTRKSQLFNAKLDYADSLNQLMKVLQAGGVDTSILNKIQNKTPQTIYDMLTKLPKTNLFQVYAPQSGVTLMPSSEGSSDASKKPLAIGSQVKSEQELLAIGDMSGVSVSVKIPENYIDKIKEGQKAIITGDAFPRITLEGKVISVGRQSIKDNGNSVPTYAVTVTVPNISKEARNVIRIGMSANVEFRLESLPVISIPLTAVFMKNGQPYVKKIDPQSDKVLDVLVETGRTSLKSIEIIKGLKDNDKVLVNASTD